MRTVMSCLSESSDLGSRDAINAATLRATCLDPAFWDRARNLRLAVAPLASFSGWLRGCECHDADRLAGKVVQCPWQGCRAPRLADRTLQTLGQLEEVRAEMHRDQDFVGALTFILRSLRLKMAWVFEEPYLVWQARFLIDLINACFRFDMFHSLHSFD